MRLFLFKIAYAHNISRKGSFIFLAALHIVLVGISTFVLLPVVRYELSSSRTKPKTKDSNFNEETKEEREGFINEDEYKERTTGMLWNFDSLR